MADIPSENEFLTSILEKVLDFNANIISLSLNSNIFWGKALVWPKTQEIVKSRVFQEALWHICRAEVNSSTPYLRGYLIFIQKHRVTTVKPHFFSGWSTRMAIKLNKLLNIGFFKRLLGSYSEREWILHLHTGEGTWFELQTSRFHRK